MQRCIDSIRRQSYPHFEIILVDDGSSDSSPAICDAAAREDARVRVLHQKNSGVSQARNNGISASKGGVDSLLRQPRLHASEDDRDAAGYVSR
ncbi:MAG: glycosyltransferase [Alistipes putredinis]|nr:MAG: glycosyltransferase [Alistipes putredinis]